jgi:catechol 2,3-dioxygenase-like lactoylglutathione lyase family enzyme
VQAKTLDHVAFWVADRHRIGEFAERHLGMHAIVTEETFTLLGSDARRGKLTLFDAEGPRDPGPFRHVGLRVNDLSAARAALPAGTPDVFDIGDGIAVVLVEAATEVD